MKRILVILSLFLFIDILYASEFEYIYSDWIDYYPENISEIRIESQDRYRWFKIENDERFETQEYYDFLDGYERIEESKKTYYRVINNEYIIFNEDGNLIKDLNECKKVFCTKVYIEPFIPNEQTPEEPSIPDEEEIVNPNTFDPLYYYYYSFIICFSILIIINIRKIYLVMSNCFKYLLK